MNTNWSSPQTNIFSAIWSLRGALASGGKYVLIKEYNENCSFPIRVNPKLPWNEQVSKKFKYKLWVVASFGKYHARTKEPFSIPFYIKLLNVLLYPLKYIPRKDTLRMPEYTIHTFRIGGVINGYSVQIQIPKKFSFK